MNYTKIASLSNPKIKEALDIKKKPSKYKHAAFIIEGPHLIEMALSSGSRLNKVFFTSAFASKKDGEKLLRQLSKRSDVIPAKAGIRKPSFQELKTTSELDSLLGESPGVTRRSLSRTAMRDGNDGLELFEVTEQIIKKIADTETPQGILAIASYKPLRLSEITFKSVPLLMIVDGIQEPGNLGTIIRTSDAAGADAMVILKGTCDAFSQKAIRATAGSIFNIPIVYAETDELLKWLNTKNINLAATALDAGESIFDADLKKSLALVFGNEAHGVSGKLKKNASLLLNIPIFGKAESLNVAASAAVCLYEAIRQRSK